MQDAANNLVVTTANDTDDGACTSTLCSLRDAINAANLAGGGTIKFDIPGGGGARTIAPDGALPAITAPTTIDGFTQGGSPNTLSLPQGDNASLKIELTGSGLEVDQGGEGSVIRGLSFTGVFGTAIDVETDNVTVAGNFIGLGPGGTDDGETSLSTGVWVAGSHDVVGGPNPADRNVIANAGFFDFSGIDLTTGSDVTVQGNYIGTDASGAVSVPNDVGVAFLAGATGDTVKGNLISGNSFDGINVTGAGASGNTIVGNRIGTTADGTGALPNEDGIDVAADNTTIGGTGATDPNVISGNDGDGISVNSGTGAQIVGNRIGTTADGTTALGNLGAGLETGSPANTTIQDNVLSANVFEGMRIGGSSTATTIVGNLIGTNGTGTVALGNGGGEENPGNGIEVSSGATGVSIGGSGAETGTSSRGTSATRSSSRAAVPPSRATTSAPKRPDRRSSRTGGTAS